MKPLRPALILLLVAAPAILKAQDRQSVKDTIVQFDGVTMTADSLRAIPGVSVVVMGQNRGTVSNDRGLFSIVAMKGDVIRFSAIGFKNKDVTIPTDIKGSHFSMIQLMVEDTTYLPVTIIRPYPTREEFPNDFLTWKIPDDQYEIARQNTEQSKLRALTLVTPNDAQASVGQYFSKQAEGYYYSGQQRPVNIFNPIAWAQFIQAWKNGDFKKQQ